jgi:hypothetical protein
VATGVVILRVSKTNGEVITFAGGGVPGNADGVGTGASFNTIYGLWTDGTTIYLAESTVVRSVVIRTQQVGTVAGLPGTLSDEDGVATNAHFYLINSITGDDDYLYVGESSGSVRRISRATAEVSTIIGQRNPLRYLGRWNISICHRVQRMWYWANQPQYSREVICCRQGAYLLLESHPR